MNTPILHSLSTYQDKMRLLSYNRTSSNGILSEEQQTWMEAIKDDFFIMGYKSCTKNFDTTKSYDIQVYDGNKDDKVLGTKKFKSYPYETVQFAVGDYLSFEYPDKNTIKNWIITSMEKNTLYEVTGNLQQCTGSLKWYDTDGKLKSVPYAPKDYAKAAAMITNANILTTSSRLNLFIQANDVSNTIKQNYRFLLGANGNYSPWKVLIPNTYFGENLILLDVVYDSFSPKDDRVNGITNNSDTVPISTDGIVVTPTTYSICQGSSQQYTVYNWFNGTQTTDKFTFTASGVTSDYYTMTNVGSNSFTITNLRMNNSSKLQILCTDTTTSKTMTLYIQLKGRF